eukprot:4865212-Amphidinium_carterae.1
MKGSPSNLQMHDNMHPTPLGVVYPIMGDNCGDSDPRKNRQASLRSASGLLQGRHEKAVVRTGFCVVLRFRYLARLKE